MVCQRFQGIIVGKSSQAGQRCLTGTEGTNIPVTSIYKIEITLGRKLHLGTGKEIKKVNRLA